jgi:hypothetical protein
LVLFLTAAEIVMLTPGSIAVITAPSGTHSVPVPEVGATATAVTESPTTSPVVSDSVIVVDPVLIVPVDAAGKVFAPVIRTFEVALDAIVGVVPARSRYPV